MLLRVFFFVALAVFLLGLVLRILPWFRHTVGSSIREARPAARAIAALRAIMRTVFGVKLPVLARVFVVDVLLLGRVWRESRLRWLAHMSVFYGFMMLLLFHALEGQVSARLFPDYASTLNPYLTLRNLSFVLVMIGLGIAVVRRVARRSTRFAGNRADAVLLILVAAIMVSGVLLEAVKMGSYRAYQRMVQDYCGVDDEEDLKGLEAFWVSEFGVVSPTATGPFDARQLAVGSHLHDEYCSSCHSRPQWAPVSYGVAKALRPVAAALDDAGIPNVLWVIHWMISFAALAILPFGKLLHALTGPLSLLANGVSEGRESDPAGTATRQMMELDACVHCGICTSRCSVAAVVEEVANRNILPAEKIVALKGMIGGRTPDPGDLARIQEGLYLCTNCRHCTDACPMGINLQELWFNVREALLERGIPEMLTLSPLSIGRGLSKDRIPPEQYLRPTVEARRALDATCASLDGLAAIDDSHLSGSFRALLAGSVQGDTYTTCLECRICTASCPVVRQCDNPAESLGMVPHQIMHAAKLGLEEPVYRSAMLWKCLGCYECQESCPQGVRVTDVLYELKNMAVGHVRAAAADRATRVAS